ncbi:MAG: phosphopantothenoylcysteine decarboxylase [Candidatus Omnitrophota bacterium]
MAISLKGKKILITAGPTWVPLDSVRSISNSASGKTGILLANALARLGAKITLILGPVPDCRLNKGIRTRHFKYFAELNSLLKEAFKKARYDMVVHSAAVADYQPVVYRRNKISSGKKTLKINLKPTPKLVDGFRKAGPDALLVGFKFEPDLTGPGLIKKANGLLKRAGLDLVVANTARRKHYRAYLVSKNNYCGPYLTKEAMVKNLIRHLKPLT